MEQQQYYRTNPGKLKRAVIGTALALLLALVPANGMLAQVFTGKVTSDDGTPIPHASLYFKDLATGVMAGDDGQFNVTLPEGEHICEVSSIGHKRLTVTVAITDGTTTEMDLMLEQQIYMLSEVIISSTDEDPAMQIMRNAIAKAPLYATQPDTMLAETYFKGKGKFKKIPKIIQRATNKDSIANDMLNSVFIFEKVSKIAYKAPGKTNETVEAFMTTFPAELVGDELYTSYSNYYSEELYGCTSPLSSNAFRIYNFSHEGSYQDKGMTMHRIAVTPKKDLPNTFKGTICIADDTWSLAAADLQARIPSATINIKAAFDQQAGPMFLPTSQTVKCEITAMGFVLEASINQSYNYAHIGLAAEAGNQTTNSKKEKLAQKIDDLQSGDKTTNAQAKKAARLTKKLVKLDNNTQNNKNKYELTTGIWGHKATIDSLAKSRDSNYWETKRIASLDEEELEAYGKAVKWKQAVDSAANQKDDALDKTMQFLTTGVKWTGKKQNWWIETGGISDIIPAYNLVDGFWIGLSTKAGIKAGDKAIITATAGAYYLEERKACAWHASMATDYAPTLRGRLELSARHSSADFNSESPEGRIATAIATSLFARNDAKFYDSRKYEITNRIEPANGLEITAGLSFEQRATLENAKNSSWFKKQAKPNIPDNPLYTDAGQHETLALSLTASYTPAHWYAMHNGWKQHYPSAWPTFTIAYRKAFATGDNSPSYHKVEISAKHKAKAGARHNITWQAAAGMFIDAKQMALADFKHFAATTFPLTELEMDNSLARANNYQFSTNDRWVQASFSWHAPRLIFKWIPFMRYTPFDEALHLRGLATQGNTPYWEGGYSIGITSMARLGVFAGFEGKQFQSTGVTISLPILSSKTGLQGLF